MINQKGFEQASFSAIKDEEDELPNGTESKELLSYEEVKTGDKLESYIDDIAETVRIGLDQSISILTPWFFNNMPRIYYQTTPRQEKVRHLSAIITGHVFETKQTVELWDRDRSKVTFIGPGGDRKILVDMASKLSTIDSKMGSLYFSRDKLLFLSTFFCREQQPLDLNNERIAEKIRATQTLLLKGFPQEKAMIENYLSKLDNDFVISATAQRLFLTYRMYRYMSSHEGAHTILESIENTPTARLTLGIKNLRPSEIFEQIVHLIHRYDFNIGRAFIVNFAHSASETVTVMHFLIEHPQGERVDLESITMLKLIKALRTLGWTDVDEYTKLTMVPYNYSINAANLIRATAIWAHLFLGKENPYIYSMHKVQMTLFKYNDLTKALVELFRIKFDPLVAELRNNNAYSERRQTICQMIEELLEEVDRNIFKEILRFIDYMLKTNYFLSTKTGLAFRLDSDVLHNELYQEKPFGVYFIIGRDYRFFHVRWKEISRGGLRIVIPRTEADYDYAFSGLFDEVYGLSYAQQMKNKDIPEGGSKGVLLLRPKGHRDQAFKGAVNALLDLLVLEDEQHEAGQQIISYYNKEEIIYLGPDENVTNDLINWVATHAERRGYKYAAAFMSSKPDAGINHKEFGVTSEGLNVFLENMLAFLGIDPRQQAFTVKMTGGPDGDVAGNELKILYREFGENAKVVAIADGYGAAYDPNGLNWKELLRLTKEERSIAQFNASLLSKSTEAFVIKADNVANTRIRNDLHFKAPADIFIPAGGRPYTVNEKNWNRFLDENGKPTARAIIEGANIFFTPGARKLIQEHSVYIIKDSSANKCGVISSSYEIIAALTLTSKEFLEIKKQYVKEVIDILRYKADAEAKLLFRSYLDFGKERSLVELSTDISQEINEVTDILLGEFSNRQDEILNDPWFHELIYRHCPHSLVKKYKDRILDKLPKAHQIAILSAYIASYIIYREGLGWLHHIPLHERLLAAKTYMEKDQFTFELIESVNKSNIKEKDQIVAILRRSAAKDLTMFDIESQPSRKTQKKRQDKKAANITG